VAGEIEFVVFGDVCWVLECEVVCCFSAEGDELCIEIGCEFDGFRARNGNCLAQDFFTILAREVDV